MSDYEIISIILNVLGLLILLATYIATKSK